MIDKLDPSKIRLLTTYHVGALTNTVVAAIWPHGMDEVWKKTSGQWPAYGRLFRSDKQAVQWCLDLPAYAHHCLITTLADTGLPLIVMSGQLTDPSPKDLSFASQLGSVMRIPVWGVFVREKPRHATAKQQG
jgi:hypothetical protein